MHNRSHSAAITGNAQPAPPVYDPFPGALIAPDDGRTWAQVAYAEDHKNMISLGRIDNEHH